jgi:hypothetical protein
MPSLVMTTRCGPPSVSITRIRPRLRRASITLVRAPPLSLRLSGRGRTARSARCAAAPRITSWGSLSLVMGKVSIASEGTAPSYEPEPRRLELRRAGAGDRGGYSACSPSLKALSVTRFSISA